MTENIQAQESFACWVCLSSDLPDRDRWANPCKCSGTSKWVHEKCVLRWIDQKQKGNPNALVNCPICLYEYKMYPSFNPVENLFYSIDKLFYQITNIFFQAYILILSRIMSAMYGCLVIVQIIGIPAGLNLLKHFTIIFLVVAQSIPVFLLIVHLICWDLVSQQFFLWVVRKWGISNDPNYPTITMELYERRFQAAGLKKNVCFCRMVMDALLSPTMSYILGSIFFSWVKMNIYRFIAGFILFSFIKLNLSLYLKLRQYKRMNGRKVNTYSENNPPPTPIVPPPVRVYHDVLEQLLFGTI